MVHRVTLDATCVDADIYERAVLMTTTLARWRVMVNGTAYMGMARVHGDDSAGPGIRAGDCDFVVASEANAELTQLRGNLSLAEEGLANYALEVERLKEANRQLQAHGQEIWAELKQLRGSSEPCDGQVLREGDCECGRHWVVKGDPGAVISVLAFHCSCGRSQPAAKSEGAPRGAGSHYCIDCNEAHDPRTCGALKSGDQS